MGSGKKKQPSYDVSESTIAPAIAVLDPTPATVLPVDVPEAAAPAVESSQVVDAAVLAPPVNEPAQVVSAEEPDQDPELAAALEPTTGPLPGVVSSAPDDLVTPIAEGFSAEVIAAGAPGKPILLGGADVEDMTAVVVGYQSGDGNRFVLHTKVRPETEEKVIDALSATEPKTTLVEKQVEAQGRLPLDVDKGIYEQLAKVTKSVNHHIGEGTEIPAHTTEAMSGLHTDLLELSQKLAISPQDAEMISAYAKALDQVRKAAETKVKSPWVPPFEATHMKTVKEEVVLPPDPDALQGLPAKLRDATKLAALEEGGVASWDGATGKPGKGKEYLIDLGNGYQAIYRSHTKSHQVPFSRQGTLEVVAPKGAGAEALLPQLEKLNIQSAPATKEEAELMYLERNVWAQRLTKEPGYLKIQQESKSLNDAEFEKVAHEVPYSEIAGMDQSQLNALARSLALRAERRVIPTRTAMLKRFFEDRMGLAEGGLEKLPTYHPEPESGPGFLTWRRFDRSAEQIHKAVGTKKIVHELTSGNKVGTLCQMIESGGLLASTDVRARMGVHVHSMSPDADQHTGGAAYVFTRVRGKGAKCDLEWDPENVLSRSDWFGYPSDHYGAINPSDHHYSSHSFTTDPAKLASFKGSSNEVMFKNGLPLLGPRGVRRMWVAGESERQQVMAALAKVGVTEIAGRPVDEVVKTR
jgi:hypothetical protein